jgi:ubiquitin-like protein ATG12
MGFAVKIRLQPIGSAPQLKTRVFYAATDRRFEAIIIYIRRKLGVKPHESVFCYVGNVFAPGLDEGVGNLWRVSLLFLFSLWNYWGGCSGGASWKLWG